MAKVVKLVVSLVFAVVLSGCASKITSDVTRFHTLTAVGGATVRIVPKDEAKKGSLEFQDYAQLIGERLGALGYRPAPPGTEPDYLVRIDYGVGQGEVRSRYYADYPYYYGYGAFGHHGFFGGYPYYGGYSSGYTYTVYPRKLEMDMVRADTGEVVFEGVVDSMGRNKHLNEVMYYLVQAMFDGFPGEHGVTHRVTIKVPTKQARSSY